MTRARPAEPVGAFFPSDRSRAAPRSLDSPGLWDRHGAHSVPTVGLADPTSLLEDGRLALGAGDTRGAAVRFALALRGAPAMAPAILDALAGVAGPVVELVRADAYRAAGHEADAMRRLCGRRGRAGRRPGRRRQDPGGIVNERTLVLVKPDGVQRLLAGRILARYEERGLRLVGLKLMQVSRDLAERHYAVHREKPFFRGLVEFIISAPLVAAVLEGPNAIAVVRAMNGATRPHEAAPGTVRGDFALETAQNLVHASDGADTAATEIALWFDEDELLDYPREIDRWVLAPDE